jgi:hypothetical protein
MYGLRMSGKEKGVMEGDIGVLQSGKLFRYGRKNIVADREGKNIEFEKKDTDIVIHMEGIRPKEGKEKEKYYQISPIEGYPLHPSGSTQDRLCFQLLTLCESPRFEVRYETLSLLVSE